LLLLAVRIKQLAAMSFEAFERAFLIRPHEPAVTRDVRGENGGQLAFDAFRGQGGGLQPLGPNGLSALGVLLTVNARASIPFRRAGPLCLALLDAFPARRSKCSDGLGRESKPCCRQRPCCVRGSRQKLRSRFVWLAVSSLLTISER